MTLRVGAVLTGFCEGHFGRDFYGDKTVEAIGHDWVVVREDGIPLIGNVPPEHLEKFLKGPEPEQTHELIWKEFRKSGPPGRIVSK